MCRSIDEGGRRCPSNRGARRRAYARARYAAKKVEAARAKGFSPQNLPPASELASLSTEQLVAVRESAREAVAERTAAVNAIAEACELDTRQGTWFRGEAADEIQALRERVLAGEPGPYMFRGVELTSEELANPEVALDRKYVTATQEVGTALSLAADATYEMEAREEGWNDKNVRYQLLYDSHRHYLEPADVLAVFTSGPGDDLLRDVSERTEPVAMSEIEDLFATHAPLVDAETLILRRKYDAFNRDNRREKGMGNSEYAQLVEGATHVPAAYAVSILEGIRSGAQSQSKQVKRRREDYLAHPERYIPDMRKARMRSVREELERVQDFGGEKWDDISVYGKVTDVVRDSVSSGLSDFPDGMVAAAKERYPDLHVRYTSARAHFSSRTRVPQRVSRHTWVQLPGDKWDALVWELDKTHDRQETKWMNTGYLNRDATANRPTADVSVFDEDDFEHVQEWCDAHNDGRTKMAFPVVRRSNRSRKYKMNAVKQEREKLKAVKFTDDDGIVRVGIRAVRGRTETESVWRPLLTTNGTQTTTVHELAHAIESHPRIHRACKRFLYDRTAGIEETLYHSSVRRGIRVNEYTKADGFYSTYVGKDYEGTNNTEVFSMGMEGCMTNGALVTGTKNRDSDGNRTLVQDTAHRDLILGLLASFPRA